MLLAILKQTGYTPATDRVVLKPCFASFIVYIPSQIMILVLDSRTHFPPELQRIHLFLELCEFWQGTPIPYPKLCFSTGGIQLPGSLGNDA